MGESWSFVLTNIVMLFYGTGLMFQKWAYDKKDESGLIIYVLSVCIWNSVMLWQKSHALTRISCHFWSLPASRAMSQTDFYSVIASANKWEAQMIRTWYNDVLAWKTGIAEIMLISILNRTTQWTILAVTDRTFCACPKIIHCQIYTSISGWVSLFYGFTEYEPVIHGAESNIGDDFGLGVVGLCFPFMVRHQGHFIKAITCS